LRTRAGTGNVLEPADHGAENAEGFAKAALSTGARIGLTHGWDVKMKEMHMGLRLRPAPLAVSAQEQSQAHPVSLLRCSRGRTSASKNLNSLAVAMAKGEFSEADHSASMMLISAGEGGRNRHLISCM